MIVSRERSLYQGHRSKGSLFEPQIATSPVLPRVLSSALGPCMRTSRVSGTTVFCKEATWSYQEKEYCWTVISKPSSGSSFPLSKEVSHSEEEMFKPRTLQYRFIITSRCIHPNGRPRSRWCWKWRGNCPFSIAHSSVGEKLALRPRETCESFPPTSPL